jgi:hypothetical protein
MLEEVIVESERGHPASKITLFRLKIAVGITNKCEGDIMQTTSLQKIFLNKFLTLEGELKSLNCNLRNKELLLTPVA